MRRIICIIVTCMTAWMVSSCVEEKEESLSETPSREDLVDMKFTASFADDTKTILVDGVNVWWEPEDYILINGEYFRSTNTEISESAEFVGSAVPAEEYYAIYPPSRVEVWNDGNKTAQVYVRDIITRGSFASGDNLSVARSEDQSLHFENMLGYVKFTLTDKSWKIKTIEVIANDGETLFGTCRLEWQEGIPRLTPLFTGPAFSAIIQTADDCYEEGDYYIPMIPGTFKYGLTFRFTSVDGKVGMLKINKEIALEKGYIQNIGKIEGLQDRLEVERQALISLYEATGGDNWTINDNWCSDRPVNEWYGVGTLNKSDWSVGKHVTALSLNDNNLVGSIPPEIGNLTELFGLHLDNNHLSGPVPSELGSLTGLIQLNLYNNQLTGSLPAGISDFHDLEVLNIASNHFSGPFPPELAKCMDNINYYHFDVTGNDFSGKIPDEISSHPRFIDFWPSFLGQNARTLDISELDIPAPTGKYIDMYGNEVDLSAFYAENELTIFYVWGAWCPHSQETTSAIIPLLDAYASKGLGALGYVFSTEWQWPHDDMETIVNTIEKLSIPWTNIVMTDDIQTGEPVNFICSLFKIPITPVIIVVDKTGKIVYQPIYCTTGKDQLSSLIDLLVERFGEEDIEDPDLYESTDYSSDGEVVVMQTATKGDGIDIVFVGDGFVDKDMSDDGYYETVMKNGMESFFSEPLMSHFRDYFNVYAVKAVSKNNFISETAETVFSTWFGSGTLVGGSDATCFEYALKVDGIDLSESLVICIMNQKYYAGTCYMNTDNSAVAYFPLGYDDGMFTQLLNHEAVGHGFGKLLDEYENNLGEIDVPTLDYFMNMSKPLGWGANVDVVSDPDKVQWKDFLTDVRYEAEGLGVYEGALTFQYGAYRPSVNSIMRYNTGGFNAPSRYAIYRRIMEYAGVKEYDYETFAEYDQVNLASYVSEPIQKKRVNYVEQAFVPTAPPVILNRSWKDAE